MPFTTNRRHFTLGLLAGACGSRAAAATAFDPDQFERLTLAIGAHTVTVRAYTGLSTVSRPVEAAYQALDLYAPEAYFHGGSVGRYTAATAPIFLPNAVGGYLPARPATPDGRPGRIPGGMPPSPTAGTGPSALAVALSRGLVVAAPGARGRTLRGPDGRWTGKAPAAIVDLKAAVRWLRHNAGRLPGNPERIVANGTSAGGALSALLGASGNGEDYEAELQALGAAPARDDVFAVSAYCPITNLENADGAYEWQFHGLAEHRQGRLGDEQLALSAQLRGDFIAYVNATGLRDAAGELLRLDAQGEGTLLAHVRALLLASAQRARDGGQDLSGLPWLRIDAARVTGIDFAGYVRAIGRLKGVPAFDGLALETGENSLFGDARTDARHFTAFASDHSRVPRAALADMLTVRQMNPMAQLADARTRPARHWRIRHGSADRDTSLAVPALLAAAARERGAAVDLAFPWDRPHGGDYDLDDLFAWIDAAVAAG